MRGRLHKRGDALYENTDPAVVAAVQNEVHSGFFRPENWIQIRNGVIASLLAMMIAAFFAVEYVSPKSEKQDNQGPGGCTVKETLLPESLPMPPNAKKSSSDTWTLTEV